MTIDSTVLHLGIYEVVEMRTTSDS